MFLARWWRRACGCWLYPAGDGVVGVQTVYGDLVFEPARHDYFSDGLIPGNGKGADSIWPVRHGKRSGGASRDVVLHHRGEVLRGR